MWNHCHRTHKFGTIFSNKCLNCCTSLKYICPCCFKDNGQPETGGVAKHCEMFDNFFDCMSVLNTQECITKQRPFLKSFLSVDDEKL